MTSPVQGTSHCSCLEHCFLLGEIHAVRHEGTSQFETLGSNDRRKNKHSANTCSNANRNGTELKRMELQIRTEKSLRTCAFTTCNTNAHERRRCRQLHCALCLCTSERAQGCNKLYTAFSLMVLKNANSAHLRVPHPPQRLLRLSFVDLWRGTTRDPNIVKPCLTFAVQQQQVTTPTQLILTAIPRAYFVLSFDQVTTTWTYWLVPVSHSRE